MSQYEKKTSQTVTNSTTQTVAGIQFPVSLYEVVSNLERSYIQAALEQSNFNRDQAAKLLGIKRTTLVMKAKRLNMAIQRSPQDKRDMTHCLIGHPFGDDNVYIIRTESGRIHRRCKICANQNAKRRYLQKKLERIRRENNNPQVPQV
jgi:DNA-binding protein Fis